MNIYFDNNTISDLVKSGIDPVSALASSEFVVSVTPDLATEYRQAINHEKPEQVSPAERELCRRLLTAATERGIFGFAEAGSGYSGLDYGVWASDGMIETIQAAPITSRPSKEIPKNRTDAFLAALSDGAIVITNDTGSHFNHARAAGQHVYSLMDVVNSASTASDIMLKLGRLLGTHDSEAPSTV